MCALAPSFTVSRQSPFLSEAGNGPKASLQRAISAEGERARATLPRQAFPNSSEAGGDEGRGAFVFLRHPPPLSPRTTLSLSLFPNASFENDESSTRRTSRGLPRENAIAKRHGQMLRKTLLPDGGRPSDPEK